MLDQIQQPFISDQPHPQQKDFLTKVRETERSRIQLQQLKNIQLHELQLDENQQSRKKVRELKDLIKDKNQDIRAQTKQTRQVQSCLEIKKQRNLQQIQNTKNKQHSIHTYKRQYCQQKFSYRPSVKYIQKSQHATPVLSSSWQKEKQDLNQQIDYGDQNENQRNPMSAALTIDEEEEQNKNNREVLSEVFSSQIANRMENMQQLFSKALRLLNTHKLYLSKFALDHFQEDIEEEQMFIPTLKTKQQKQKSKSVERKRYLQQKRVYGQDNQIGQILIKSNSARNTSLMQSNLQRKQVLDYQQNLQQHEQKEYNSELDQQANHQKYLKKLKSKNKEKYLQKLHQVYSSRNQQQKQTISKVE